VTTAGGVAFPALRPFPYPYRALFAICSDLDETPDRQVYEETLRYLNTMEATSMGPGLGLEVGHSLYFDMDPAQFAYWNTDDAGRELARALIRSGHIDCIHSFGDLATTRAHAGRSLDELSRHGCRIEVWTDHAVAPSNLGHDIMQGQGDLAGSEAYHADLTWDFGVRYVWRGRVTSVIGQDVPRRLTGIFRARHPLASARTLAKELAKGVLARAGSVKYAMHGSNEVLRGVRLRSGQRVWEFLRSNPCWMAVDKGESAEGVAEVIDRTLLNHLAERGGVTLLYTHLGKVTDRREPLPVPSRRALGLLAEANRAGRILVTTTRRALGYCHMRQRVRFEPVPGEGLTVDVRMEASESPNGTLPADLAGLTLYVREPERTRLTFNGRPVDGLRRNPPDHTGRPSVSLPWRPLAFPRP
jgi:hypothetical protein